MKILHVTNTYPTENLPLFGIFIKEQIDALNEAGFKGDVFFINGWEKGKIEYLKSFFRLRKIINNYDIVHAHHFLTAIVVLSLKPRGKVIVSFLSDGIKEFIRPDNFLFNYIVKRNLYNFILRNSKARIFKKSIPNRFKNDRLSFYLPNGVNTGIFHPIPKAEARKNLNLDIKRKYILFSCLIEINRPEKRYDLFCKTLDILKRKDSSIDELTMVNVERCKVPLYFNAADLHLLTSDFEGSPNSVKEALACNTPVVSRDVGNVKEMIDGLKKSFVCSSGSAELLAEKVLQCLDIKEEEDSRSLIISKKLDINSNAIELGRIYQTVYND